MNLSDLKPDTRNANKGTQRGLGMVEKSLRQYGAGRSILTDKDGNVIAGNKTLEAAVNAGFENIRVVETDGTELVVVKRTDIKADSKRGRELAIADNRTAEVGLEWDTDTLTELMTEGVDLGQFWYEDELESLLSRIPGADDWQDSIGDLPDGDRAPFQQMTFTLSDEQAEEVKRALDAAKASGAFVDTGNENSNGNALARVCMDYVTRHGG